MKLYFYWYFTIYHIYKKLSRDPDFDTYATAMFSLPVVSFLISVSGFLMIFLGCGAVWFQYGYILPLFMVFILCFNFLLFLKKYRQIRLYRIYLEERKWWKDAFFLLFSVFSIALGIYYIEYCRIYYPPS